MDSMDLSVLNHVLAWGEAGHSVALATLVETWGSAPRPVGACLAIRDDGQIVGSVSGGCVEDDLIDRASIDIFPHMTPQVLLYGVNKEEAARFGLPCGGTLRLVVEPRPDLALLRVLRERIARNQMALRVIDMASGKSRIEDASSADATSFDGTTLRVIYGPLWRLLIVGGGQLSQYVANIALTADYQVVVVDPRLEFSEAWSAPNTEFIRGMPDDVILELGIDSRTAIIALTHDPKLDDMALLEALKSPAFYVGALGSRVNTAKRKLRLAAFDLSAEEIGRLQGPIGIYIGSRTPPEMAISIMAEITAYKNRVPVLQKRELRRDYLVSAAACIDRMSV
ncbi:MAG: XdhC family protein [Betaproteobacteria bacterium]|nr:XdhC family protein [Betaproteobacteria bacterium]